MNHPILESFRKTIAYLVTWLVFAIISFFFLYFKHHLSIEGSIINSIMVNLFFAVMGITIWYAVYFSYPEKIGISNVIINHCISASVIILFLVGSVTLFNKVLLNPYDADFIQQHIRGFVFTCLIFYITTVLVYYNIVYNYYLKQRKENEERLLSIIKQTELDMLKSQINPHFLFNSLNSISSLTITNPAKAQEMIIKLSDYLRYSIKYNSTQLTTLQAELDNMLRYLDIEKIRFGSRLNYLTNISEDCYKATLPVMILQPLFENAIKHGVYESVNTITLEIEAVMNDNYLVIKVRNNYDSEVPSRKGAGIGLKNIKERLRLTYMTEGLMNFSKTEEVFEVQVLIPQQIINEPKSHEQHQGVIS